MAIKISYRSHVGQKKNTQGEGGTRSGSCREAERGLAAHSPGFNLSPVLHLFSFLAAEIGLYSNHGFMAYVHVSIHWFICSHSLFALSFFFLAIHLLIYSITHSWFTNLLKDPSIYS